LLEIVFVAGSFILELTNLLDFVMVDGESLVVESDALFGRRGLIWLLEADEGVELLDALTGRVHLEALDLTVGLEKLTELLLGHGVREALDVQVASLLGAFVLDRLAKAFSLAVSPLEGFFDVELLVVLERNTVDLRLAVELGDGFLSAAGSVLAVLLVLGVEANEGVGSLLVVGVVHAFDATELSEKSAYVSFSVVVGEVLGVDVVVDLAEIAFVAGLVSDHLVTVGGALSFKSLSGTRGLLEANEAVATGLVVRVERDLQRFDVSVAREVLFKSLRSDLLGDLAHEDVVVDNFLGVGSKEIVVEGESARWLAWGKLEVAHLFAGLREFVLLGDGHNGRVEGAVKIASDLGHTRKHNAGLVLEDRSETGAGGLILGEIVKVQIVLGALSSVHYHFVVDFLFLFVNVVFFCFLIY